MKPTHILFSVSIFLFFGLGLVGCKATTVPGSQTSLSSEPVSTLYDYSLQRADGSVLSLDALVDAVKEADVVMVGEWHTHPAVHLFQAQLMARLVEQGRPLSLSMEHFTREDQAALNRYLAGEIGESSLLNTTKAWDNYKSDYRPLVEIARENHLPVIAANAPRDIVKCVGRQGPDYIKSLDKQRQALVAQNIDVSDSPYRQKFLSNMHGMTLPEARIVKMFAAQMTWDATMAESIAKHLADNPERKVLHVAGRFHTMSGLGTGAELLKHNSTLNIAYITAVSEGEAVAGSDYRVVVVPLPPMWISDDEQHAAMASHVMSEVKCN